MGRILPMRPRHARTTRQTVSIDRLKDRLRTAIHLDVTGKPLYTGTGSRREAPSRTSQSRGSLSQPIRFGLRALPERIRAGLGQRAAAIILALLLEGLLALLLFTLAPSIMRREDTGMTVFSLDMAPLPDEVPAEAPTPDTPRPAKQPRQAEPDRVPPPPAEPQVASPAPPVIKLPPELMAAADISTMRPARPAPVQGPAVAGPPDTGTPGDSQRVSGQGPNGEPLYAASWYREPYDDELRGYLSTATGPGWGLIACRTVPDYRVEDCIAVDEFPRGSNITRAVLAAAWQFRVRPPRVGGQLKVGEWVRIRIDYQTRRP